MGLPQVGAQVMMLQNVDFRKRIVNGSRGVVIGFKTVPPLADKVRRASDMQPVQEEAPKTPCRVSTDPLLLPKGAEYSGRSLSEESAANSGEDDVQVKR